jgi:outer membrane lipoprotein SlyB
MTRSIQTIVLPRNSDGTVDAYGVVTRFCLLAVLALAVLLGSEAHAQSGNTYGVGQSLGTVEQGIVLQQRIVQMESTWKDAAPGAAIGGALGGLLGSRANSSRGTAMLVGTTLGALAGGKVSQHVAQREAQEIIVQSTDARGNRRAYSIVQPAPFTPVSVGQEVLLMKNGSQVRVIGNEMRQQVVAHTQEPAQQVVYRTMSLQPQWGLPSNMNMEDSMR